MSFNPNKFRPCPKPVAKVRSRQKRINKFSKKGRKENDIYSKKTRPEFLEKEENKICFIKGCGKEATTVEHTRGRRGFADEWARDQGITLLNDVRFFKPCCWDHNGELERNPELSKEYQLSKIHGGKKL